MKAVWTLEQGARISASSGGSPPRPSRPCRREPESKAATTLAATGSPVRRFHEPVPALRLPHERSETVGQGSERHAESGAEAHRAAVTGRRPELPRLGGGDQHPLLVAVGGRHQVDVFDGARLAPRRTPTSRCAPRARRAAGCRAGAGGRGRPVSPAGHRPGRPGRTAPGAAPGAAAPPSTGAPGHPVRRPRPPPSVAPGPTPAAVVTPVAAADGFEPSAADGGGRRPARRPIARRRGCGAAAAARQAPSRLPAR